MKILHSFWSKPAQKNPASDRIKLPLVTYLLQTLSCLKYKEFYPIHLVTDRKGKEILIDIMELPYDSVSVELDVLNDYPAAMWAVGKMYTYNMQNEPFLHVDGDTFIWGEFPGHIEKAELIVQNIESAQLYPANTVFFTDMHAKLNYVPFNMEEEWKTTGGLTEINAGVFGGNDLGFIKFYVEEAFKFIEKNYKKIPTFGDADKQGAFNIVFEQYLFYCLAKHNRKEVTYLINYEKEEDLFDNLMYLHTVPFPNKYIHMFAGFKHNPMFLSQMGQLLWAEYPEYYNRIMENIKKGYL